MRSSSLLGLAAAIITLTACHDFVGSSNRLGFSSDARVGGAAWTPNVPLAAGARPRLAVTELIGEGEDAPGSVRWSADGPLLHLDGKGVWLEGPEAGQVRATADGLDDSFQVQWTKAARTGLREFLSEVESDGPLVLLDGGTTMLETQVTDRDGNALGHVPAQLQIRHGDSIHTEIADGRVVVHGQALGTTELTVGWPGTRRARVRVHTVSSEAVDTLELVERWFGAECVLEAVLSTDGDVVSGPEGFRWSHDSTRDRFAPCAAEATVAWSDLEVTAD